MGSSALGLFRAVAFLLGLSPQSGDLLWLATESFGQCPNEAKGQHPFRVDGVVQSPLAQSGHLCCTADGTMANLFNRLNEPVCDHL
ncbi:hypothetical protein GCM10009555_097930 [Acrocarpospora macrocephala]|uniref:Uncharacterized protein n=1 Tax=Acrocarpospora macrocephala TaxID=150177 RepID=A0A5M3WTE7_9ACTN|nr:hypothetical protein [Acrocarpospora macrocephala]GES12625.1 hypothetical protein Amac_062220 [Acrocarpospora macrocephala]